MEKLESVFITVVKFAEPPEYDALSYVWVKEINTGPLISNGDRVAVTKRLFDASRYR
jgi:hypothetical protein